MFVELTVRVRVFTWTQREVTEFVSCVSPNWASLRCQPSSVEHISRHPITAVAPIIPKMKVDCREPGKGISASGKNGHSKSRLEYLGNGRLHHWLMHMRLQWFWLNRAAEQRGEEERANSFEVAV